MVGAADERAVFSLVAFLAIILAESGIVPGVPYASGSYEQIAEATIRETTSEHEHSHVATPVVTGRRHTLAKVLSSPRFLLWKLDNQLWMSTLGLRPVSSRFRGVHFGEFDYLTGAGPYWGRTSNWSTGESV